MTKKPNESDKGQQPEAQSKEPPKEKTTSKTPDKKAAEETGITAEVRTPVKGGGAQQAQNKMPGKTGARTGFYPSILTILMFLVLVAAGYQIWNDFQGFKVEVSETLQPIESRLETALSKVDGFEGKINESRNRLESRITGIDEKLAKDEIELSGFTQALGKIDGAQSELENSLALIQADLSKGRTAGWLVAEAAYLIRVASHRLRFEHDPETAIVALRAADHRLKATGDPSLTDARAALADEISQIQAMPNPDLVGLALKLSVMSRHVFELPLNRIEPTPPKMKTPGRQEVEEIGSWKQAMNTLWESLKSLVVIRVHGVDENYSPLLPPEQREFLYQNLRLKLEQAQLAVLQRDTKIFQNSLVLAKDWLTRYFPESGPMENMLRQISSMEGTELESSPPEVASALKEIRKWSAQQAQDLMPLSANMNDTESRLSRSDRVASLVAQGQEVRP